MCSRGASTRVLALALSFVVISTSSVTFAVILVPVLMSGALFNSEQCRHLWIADGVHLETHPSTLGTPVFSDGISPHPQ